MQMSTKATKIITTAGVGAAIVAGSMLAVTATSAHSGGSSDERAAEIAERFDLDETEVQTYFTEKKAEHQAERAEKHAEHLASLVEDGTLTQEQADALSAKHAEMREAKEALKDQDLTKEEMQEQMEASRADLKAWAEEQGINLDDIHPEKGEGHKKGHYGGFDKD